MKANPRIQYRIVAPVISVAAFVVGLLMTPTGVLAQTPVGVVTTVSGSVSVQRGTGSLVPRTGTQLDIGDKVTTGVNGQLDATLSDNSQLELAESTSLVIDEMTFSAAGRTSTRLTLGAGSLRSSVAAAAGGVPNFTVSTPNAVVAVRGTKWNTRYQDGSARPGYPDCRHFTDVEVFEGTVDVGSTLTPSAAHQAVSAGYETTVACQNAPLEPGPIGLTGTGGIGGFRGVTPGVGVSPPPPSEPPPPLPPPPPPG